MKEQLEAIASKINTALQAKGYKPTEARASIWMKEIKGVEVGRVYLNGKKADGYVHQFAGKWQSADISFLALYRIVQDVLA